MRFFVAGARYHDLPRDVGTGERVILSRERFQGRGSYRVRTLSGASLGFVPERAVQELSRQGAAGAWLERVDLDAVPWKRYRVAVALKS
jgi:hypothetical protein